MTRAIGLILGDTSITLEVGDEPAPLHASHEKDQDLADEIESHLAHEQDANMPRAACPRTKRVARRV